MSYTLTYSQVVDGWVSFYSYDPDWMIGMNTFFYTFKGGDLYKHNSNDLRNTFYEQWCNKFPDPKPSPFLDTRVVSVFNDAVLENKLFKTISLEGDSTWTMSLYTDIQDSGFINATYFEKKEATFFAFVRNNTNGETLIRSTNGIGRSYDQGPYGGGLGIDFSVNPLVDIGSIVSIGDSAYYCLPPNFSPPIYCGPVIDIVRDYRNGINKLVINPTAPGATSPSIDDAYFMFLKNSVAESHGVVGHYCVFDMTSSSVGKIELFTVRSEVMKSFP